MQSHRSPPAAILIATAAALAVSGAADAFPDSDATALHPVCRKRVGLTERGNPYLLFEATSETVVAGPGSMEVAAGPEERVGPGRVVLPTSPVPDTVEVRGQRVRVEAVVGAEDVAPLARARGAVLVPWGYAPDCRPLVWSRSAHWIDPGVRGVVNAALRPREEWTGDVPTFDVHDPYPWPYPQAERWSRHSGGPLMTADEFFAFVRLLPTRDRTGDLAAYGELLAWARAHPEVAERHPAGSVIRRLRSAPHLEEARALEVPFAGTYRLRVTRGDRTAERWVRTAERPERAWTPPATPWDREGPLGFALDVHATERGETPPGQGRDVAGLAPLLVSHPPDVRGDSLVWEGHLPAQILDRAMRAEGWERGWLSPAVRRAPDELPYVPLRIVLGPGHRATATVRWPEDAAGEPVAVELERVSDVTTEATGEPAPPGGGREPPPPG